MRLAEIVTAGVLALLSIYLMWKSTELNVGYIPDEGPGGGFWPFWLSGIMLICTGLIAFNWFRRTSPPSQSTDVLLDGYGKRTLVLVGGGLLGFIALINIISMYGAMVVFLIYYLRFLGRHSWTLTAILSISIPVVFFIFFEALMRITLPKGMKFTEPFYNFLNTIIY
ncbi:tripartite tricarboxylate transporter TctB family protein [Sedimentitalea nanhaiensis]|uniref:Tripartite tricarboxylate transporter TctB family protein n=1 Tax=Sedimentitalea nanhaiensis TaxID=999627 RepID=A0A1I7BDN8_9RHOB|nr:tripartite tricarboxylate transporter TctB family protein [Sedimentitalea nanhaiensis]SFT85277.1 Tripartite tricarboxylate transporter TctB family protein [Sedimentitalea nanhaiensis]